jgi:hypothetical protein
VVDAFARTLKVPRSVPIGTAEPSGPQTLAG